jgi:hypothetical protein
MAYVYVRMKMGFTKSRAAGKVFIISNELAAMIELHKNPVGWAMKKRDRLGRRLGRRTFDARDPPSGWHAAKARRKER